MFIFSNRAYDSTTRRLTEKPDRKAPDTAQLYRLNSDREAQASTSQEALIELQKSEAPLLVIVHGFDQTFLKAITRAQLLSNLYEVEVILFSWPSHPVVSPFKGEVDKTIRYISNRGRSRAKRSAQALLAALKEIAELADKVPSRKMSLLVHSMGNLVLKKAIETDSPDLSPYENVILHQAEVAGNTHVDWVSRIAPKGSTWITINENDHALRITERFKKPRLGSCLPISRAPQCTYLNFTSHKGIGNSHVVWQDAALTPAKSLFTDLFHGHQPPEEVLQLFRC